jgi:SAM-dependent methyltransferase
MWDDPKNGRSLVALRRHYDVERDLADRLRTAPPRERKALYHHVYNELFRRVPDHPQLSRREDPRRQHVRTEEQLRLLRPFLRSDGVFTEIGAGDCHLTLKVAAEVRQAYGIDISDVISSAVGRPDNFALLVSDGTNIPLPDGTVDVAYSNMLMEHLHPDDAVEHIHEVYRVLTQGGVYLCRTPHRYTGPQDISQYFDEVATGFHLKEYTFGELRTLFRKAGFRATAVRTRVKGRSFPWPESLTLALERGLGVLPYEVRKRVCKMILLRSLFDCMTIIGRK